ncbi:MAG: S8 family serine peptidase, partial [Acidimicrobiia bacterium]
MRRKLLIVLAVFATMFASAIPVGAQEDPAPADQSRSDLRSELPNSVTNLKLSKPITSTKTTAVSKLDPSLLAADGPTDVIIVMSDDSLAESGKTSDVSQKAHVDSLERKQDSFLSKAEREGARRLGQTQRVINAVFVNADSETLVALAADPAVESIRPAGLYHLAVDPETQLSETVPYIGASAVQDLGVDGTGVRVAVLDSGVDYTHAALGGPGTAAAYEAAYGVDVSDPRNTTTDGLFPTAKVVGGYDFVGESWDGTPGGPPLAPDPDPIDFEGHGTHVSDIIGGSLGVAPGVDLYAVKVCSAVGTACSGIALIQGMEFAVDPNGDGKTKDAVDLINMSLGSDYGQPFDDDLSQAVDGASKLGVLTVAAAGNAGDKPFITGTPAAAATALSVAQTQVPSATIPVLEILQPAGIAGIIEDVAFQPWSVAPTSIIEAPVQYADGAGGNLDGCAPFAPGSLTGKIVLVDRGLCNFTLKIKNVGDAGALAGIIGLVAPGAPFAGGDGGDGPITIPGYMIGQDIANAIIGASPGVTMRIDPNGLPAVGQMVGSSARGPQFEDFRIKPEIGAPGASVSAIAGTGTGTGAFGGTSGATPMVTGSAALLIDGQGTNLKNKTHDGNDWKKKQDKGKKKVRLSPLELKALLMNNADTDIDVSPFVPDAPITRIGAGEVRVDQAFGAPAVAWVKGNDGAALSFGHVDVTGRTKLTQTVELKNYSNQRITYHVDASFRFVDDEANGAVKISAPSKVVLNPGKGKITKFTVTLTIDGSKLRGNYMDSGEDGANGDALTLNEYDGYLTLHAGDERPISIPWQVLPRKAADVRPNTDKFPEGGATVQLRNRGVGEAQLDAYALVAVDENLPEGPAGAQSPTPDIRGVGVNTFPVDAGFCGADASFIWAFAFDSWERHAHADFPATMWLDLDIDRDGIPDYAIYNADFAGLGSASDGRTLTWVSEWMDYPNTLGASSAYFFTEHATVTGNYVLYICGDQIGLNQDNLFQPVDIQAFAFDFYFGGPGDEVDPFTISPYGERYLGLPSGDLGAKESGTMDILDFG